MRVETVFLAIVLSVFTATVTAQELTLDVLIPELTCRQVSSSAEDRDEVYLQVYGATPLGRVNNRLPKTMDASDNDFYQFHAGSVAREAQPASWKNKDQLGLGFPQLWSGKLGPGQSAAFIVIVMEQEKGSVAPLRDQLKTAVETAIPQHPEMILLQSSLELVPEKVSDRLVGCLGIVVGNDGGELLCSMQPLSSKTGLVQQDGVLFHKDLRPARDASRFQLSESGEYQLIAWCRQTSLLPEKLRVLVGRERSFVDVDSVDINTQARGASPYSVVTIPRGASRILQPVLRESNRFYIRDSNELKQTWSMRLFDERTTVVLADFHANGDLDWSRFAEVAFEGLR